MSATGRFVFPDGSVYEGEYAVVDGTKQKHGKGRYADGHASYTGTWSGDKMHGKGTYVGASGAVYEGDFSEGKYHGVGRYRWADGAEYVGGWSQGRMHGDGSYTSADGLQFTGTFYNGMYVEGKTHIAVR